MLYPVTDAKDKVVALGIAVAEKLSHFSPTQLRNRYPSGEFQMASISVIFLLAFCEPWATK